MTKAGFIAWLNDIETTMPVSEWQVGRVSIWPMVRLQLYGAHFDVSLWPERVGGRRSAMAKAAVTAITAWAAARARDWRHDVHPASPGDAVFLAISYGTQPTIAGRRYNWLLAPYVALLSAHGRRSVVWEMSPGGDYNVPRSTPSHYVQPYLFYQRIVSLTTRAHRAMRVHLPDFDRFLARADGAGLPSRYASREALLRDAYFVRRVADRFSAWLERVGPAYGFVADCWLREQAFALACREQGVTVVDIQHGAQGELHPAYGSWQGLPAGGYATRPSVFWCWDDESAGAIERWGRPSGAAVAIAGGDPWREMWRAGTSEVASAFDREIAERRRASGADFHVLLNLDPIGSVIPDPVRHAVSQAPRNWCFWPRLHPANQRARLPEAIAAMRRLGATHVDPAYASSVPLHALLKHMDVHVTVAWSTVVVEAADFGVASVACHPLAAEIFPALAANGMLRHAAEPAALLEAIRAQGCRRGSADASRRCDPAAAMRRLLSIGRAERAVAG